MNERSFVLSITKIQGFIVLRFYGIQAKYFDNTVE